jgi:Flp pilus assembly protein protease CpaA
MIFDAQLLPHAISLLTVGWLGVCAYYDARSRHVPNWLTLSAIPLAILAAWLTRESRSETLYEFGFHLVIMTLPLFIAWHYRLLGGADLKILVVLSLVNPLLVLAAWAGVVVYFIGLRLVKQARPDRFAGVPGFALGAGLLAVSQVAMSVIQNLVV